MRVHSHGLTHPVFMHHKVQNSQWSGRFLQNNHGWKLCETRSMKELFGFILDKNTIIGLSNVWTEEGLEEIKFHLCFQMNNRCFIFWKWNFIFENRSWYTTGSAILKLAPNWFSILNHWPWVFSLGQVLKINWTYPISFMIYLLICLISISIMQEIGIRIK